MEISHNLLKEKVAAIKVQFSKTDHELDKINYSEVFQNHGMLLYNKLLFVELSLC